MNKLRIIIFLLSLFSVSSINAQGVGIGTDDPNPNTILDVKSTDKGMIIPQLALISTNSKEPISGLQNAAADRGLLIYNTATANDVTPGFYFWDGIQWVRIATGTANTGWSLTGNINTTDSNFIGTTDDKPIIMRANNEEVLGVHPDKSLSLAGVTFIKHKPTTTLADNGGVFVLNPLAIGENALNAQTSGYGNVAVGAEALSGLTTGWKNVAIGERAGRLLNTTDNVAIGYHALYSAASGASTNVAINAYALHNLTTGNENIGIGQSALGNLRAGARNIGIGFLAGIGVQGSNENISIGSWSNQILADSIFSRRLTLGVFSRAGGNDAIALGRSSAVVGDGSIAIGNNTVVNAINSVAIGTGAIASSPNSIILGSTGINQQRVGIGTASPNESALLDLTSNNRGFLPPRMSASQMSAIASPAEGLVVYCNNCLPSKGLRVFNGSNWTLMDGSNAPPAEFTFTGNYYHLPNFFAGKVLGTDNALFLEINVTIIGEITFSSVTANGYSFNGFAQVVNTGIQYVQLNPTGTQTAYNSSGDNFTITGIGTATQTQAVTITHAQLGNSLSSFSNGAENFSSNTLCASKVVSTTTAANCPATVTVGANTYNTVFINGQCWFRENLKEAPSAPCADAMNTGCNVYLNTPNLPDFGAWGFYNTTTTSGAAGWRTTEPAANEGMLYQWSAAMNGSTTERAKGVCPTGWHIPSDCEWMYLEHGQGMSISQQVLNSGTPRSTTGEGNKLRSVGGSGATLWNNSSGFTALLPGRRLPSAGAFSARGATGDFWTSSEANSTNAIRRSLGANVGVLRVNAPKASAFSIRCLKD